MNKDEFLKEVNNNINNMSLEDLKIVVMEMSKDIPSEYYYKILCRIRNLKNDLNISSNDIEKEIAEIYSDFKKVQDGDIVFRCYAIETGYYSAFGEEYDYIYYPTNEMDELLNRLYDSIPKLIFSKNYKEALKIIDLMLYSDYYCEETSNPEYGDPNEVIDTFDMDLSSLEENLDFNIDTVLLYAIYAVIMGDIEDKFKKIDCYIKGKNIDIRDCKNLGIEEIPNLDKFYEEWLKYKNKSVVLTKEGEKLAESLIEEYIK